MLDRQRRSLSATLDTWLMLARYTLAGRRKRERTAAGLTAAQRKDAGLTAWMPSRPGADIDPLAIVTLTAQR
jgi:hypothetical protein